MERARASWRETNQRDDALFETLVREDRFPVAAIEAFAQAAARQLEFTIDDLTGALEQAGVDPAIAPQLVQALAPALGRLPTATAADSPTRLAFDDVLAPQFLLTVCARQRWNKKTSQSIAGKGDDR